MFVWKQAHQVLYCIVCPDKYGSEYFSILNPPFVCLKTSSLTGFLIQTSPGSFWILYGTYLTVGNHLDQFDSSVGEWRREKDNFTPASDKLGNFCRLWAGAWSRKWANKSQTKVFLAESSVCLGCKMFSDMTGCNTYLQRSIPCFIVALWPFKYHFGTLWCGRLIVTYWWPISDHFGTSW